MSILLTVAGALATALVGGGLWLWTRVRPIRFDSFEALHGHFERLVRTGKNNTELFIRVRGGPTSLKFRLRKDPPHAPAILLDYRRLPWTEPYYSAMALLAERSGQPCRAYSAGAGRTLDTLEVEFGGDTRRAAEFAWAAILEVYGVSSPEAESDVFPLIPG